MCMLQGQAVGKTRHSPPLAHVYGAYTICNNSQLSQVFPFKTPSGEAMNIENEIENIDRKKDMKARKKGNAGNPMSFGPTIYSRYDVQ